MIRVHRAAGVTLIEVMVAAGIGALVLTAVLVAFVSTGRLMHWVTVRTDAASSLMMAVNRLGNEMRSSAWSTVTVSSTTAPGPVIAFEIADPAAADPLTAVFTSTGNLVVYYYDPAQQAIIRKVWPVGGQANPMPTPPPSGARMLAPDVQTVLNAPANGSEQHVATGVASMSLTPSTYPTTTPVTGISIVVQVQKLVNNNPEYAHQAVTAMIYPRNHP